MTNPADDLAEALRSNAIARDAAMDAGGSELVGQYVLFMRPTPSGPNRTRGKVLQVKDGKLEIRAATGGYYMIAPNELLGNDDQIATDPAVSEPQRRAAEAAVHGKSTLGISPAAGKKILGQGEDADYSNIAKGLGQNYDDEQQWKAKFPRGSMVRENRQGAQPKRVIDHKGNMLVIGGGEMLHATKAVAADTAQDGPVEEAAAKLKALRDKGASPSEILEAKAAVASAEAAMKRKFMAGRSAG